MLGTNIGKTPKKETVFPQARGHRPIMDSRTPPLISTSMSSLSLVRENGLFEPFMYKNDLLPTQARDKHRENSKTGTRFLRCGNGNAHRALVSFAPHVCPEPVLGNHRVLFTKANTQTKCRCLLWPRSERHASDRRLRVTRQRRPSMAKRNAGQWRGQRQQIRDEDPLPRQQHSHKPPSTKRRTKPR